MIVPPPHRCSPASPRGWKAAGKHRRKSEATRRPPVAPGSSPAAPPPVPVRTPARRRQANAAVALSRPIRPRPPRIQSGMRRLYRLPCRLRQALCRASEPSPLGCQRSCPSRRTGSYHRSHHLPTADPQGLERWSNHAREPARQRAHSASSPSWRRGPREPVVMQPAPAVELAVAGPEPAVPLAALADCWPHCPPFPATGRRTRRGRSGPSRWRHPRTGSRSARDASLRPPSC